MHGVSYTIYDSFNSIIIHFPLLLTYMHVLFLCFFLCSLLFVVFMYTFVNFVPCPFCCVYYAHFCDGCPLFCYYSYSYFYDYAMDHLWRMSLKSTNTFVFNSFLDNVVFDYIFLVTYLSMSASWPHFTSYLQTIPLQY